MSKKKEVVVYKIKNTKNGKIYIGGTTDKSMRWAAHRYKLRNNWHNNPRLQKEWNEYGEGAFDFSVIERVNKETNVRDREQFYLDYLQPDYNICPKANLSERSKPTRRKISETLTGRKLSEKNKSNVSKALQGRKFSKQHKTNIGKSVTGVKNGNAKLTKKKVKVIKYLLRGGQFTYQEIGDMYGVNQATIGYINTGESWNHISITGR